MTRKRIAIASDHAGYFLKESLIIELKRQQFSVIDLGCNSPEMVDYPDYGHSLGEIISNRECEIGIAICGSGNGMNMTVNKHVGVRGALCWNNEEAYLARANYNANICSLPCTCLNELETIKIIKTFISTEFKGDSPF